MTTRERFEHQFESCLRKQPVKPLTGKAKEAAEAKQLWNELEKFNQR